MGASRRALATALVGTRLGRYELVQSVAIGGMAEIYLARTQGPQRFEKYVILKRILPHLAADEQFVEMFLDEARLAASMSHSNIVQVHDFGEADGSYFFTMEYVHGEDVRMILKFSRKYERRVPIGDALTIITNAAAGLHYAHDLDGPDGQPLGVVHRDVSPSNLLITFDGTVKVADFGIAKATQRAASTRSGTVKGKVSYMSPEQCDGVQLDRRSDVFALAIILYELTTGRKLFTGENDLAIMRRITDKDVAMPSTFLPDYPPKLEAILKRALARKRDERHASALELQTDLEAFCRSEGHIVSAPSLAKTMFDLFGKRPHPWASQRQPSMITMIDDNPPDWDADSKPTTLVPAGNSGTSLSRAAAEATPIGSIPLIAQLRSSWGKLLGLGLFVATAAVVVAFIARSGGGEAGTDRDAPPTMPARGGAIEPSPPPNQPEPTVRAPTIPEPTVPTVREPTVPEPTVPEPTVPETAHKPTDPTVREPTVRESAAAKPEVTTKPEKPRATKPGRTTTKPATKRAKPETNPEVTLETKPEVTTETKPETQPETKPETEPAKPNPNRDIDSPFLPK